MAEPVYETKFFSHQCLGVFIKRYFYPYKYKNVIVIFNEDDLVLAALETQRDRYDGLIIQSKPVMQKIKDE